jgi:hypothetical protein
MFVRLRKRERERERESVYVYVCTHGARCSLQRMAYKVTYRRLRLKRDYPEHPYNSNTHNRKVLYYPPNKCGI